MSDASLGSLLDGDPDDVVAYVNDAVTTRAQMRVSVEHLASQLRDAGLAGHVIGVLAANRPDVIAAWFAVWSVGGAFVPLNPRVPPAERDVLVASTGVAAVIDPPQVRPVSGATPPNSDAAVAIVQFTSGTTGRPKAVPLRHDTVLALLDGVIGSLRGDGPPANRTPMPNLVPVSLALWAGIYQVLFAFRLGAPVVLMERFDPVEFARLVDVFGIRSSVLPPAAMVMLAREPRVTTLKPLRYVRSVSAPLSPTHARLFHERFGVAILNGYGQTELGGEVVGWTAADWREFGTAKLGAVGRPHAGIDVRVRDNELQVRSRTAAPFDRAVLGERVTDDGWLRTGDLASIDDDGFVWIEGRVSAMVNRGGLKVFPDEVEEHLRAHPSVVDAAVAGVPDDRLGEVPWAFVVCEPGVVIDADTLRGWCRDRMAPYKVPAGVTFVEKLPRNEIGKLLRQDLVPLVDRDT
ncbi:MAG TPA: AMP-binding protein [Acidimicrobiia bacterium]|nr:AMP-binding protein [Acidimicrobiia bacterium]